MKTIITLAVCILLASCKAAQVVLPQSAPNTHRMNEGEYLKYKQSQKK